MSAAADARPTICVVMPAYRSAATLDRAAWSVLGQTYRDLVLAIAIRPDDAETLAMARSIDDDRIRIVDAPPGISAARNAALRGVAADYYMFLDSDDAYASDEVVERYVADIARHPGPALRYADWTALSPADGRLQPRPVPRPVQRQFRELLLENFVATGTAMVPAATLAEVGLFDEGFPHAEDWDLWLRIVRRIPLRHVEVNACVYTRSKMGRVFPRSHFAHELTIIARQPAPWPVRALAAANSRGRYGGYFLRTLPGRRGRQLLDVRPLDLLSVPVAIAFRIARYGSLRL